MTGKPLPSATVLLALVLALPLGSCATSGPLCLHASALRQLAIISDEDSNGGRPIAIDLVYVTDRSAWQAISRLRARDYFARREQLRRDFPRGYHVSSWELQAGQQVKQTPASPPCGAIGTLVFVDYASEGDHRIAVGNARSGAIVLGATDFSWAPE